MAENHRNMTAHPSPFHPQIGVGLSDGHPKASQIGVGFSDPTSFGGDFSRLKSRERV
jgi:hypothetical protein